MSNIFCVSSYRSVGATFLDWSIHYLSGQDNFYSIRTNQTIELCQDPLQDVTAHSHLKNLVFNSSQVINTIDHLKQQKNNLLSCYVHPIHYNECMEIANISSDELKQSGSELANRVENTRQLEYKKSLNSVGECNSDLIYLHCDKTIIGYLWNERVLVDINNGRMISNEEEKHRLFFDFFYKTNNNDKPIWDIREQRALDLRPHDTQPFVTPEINFKHLWFNAQDLWGQAEDVATECVNFLNKQVDNKRLESWKPIAYKWQQIQNRNFSFARNLDHIIDYTINGYSYDISNLTFHQEVIIQHELIYKHNLNIKNWELEKFPNNTKELHKLLETNTHPVEKIYS